MDFPFPVPPAIAAKCEALEGVTASHPLLGIAYSGGADSTFLAWVLHKVLGKKVFAFFVLTPFTSARERDAAFETARWIDLPLEEIPLDPTTIPPVRDNSAERCYFCKKAIMTEIKNRARALGCTLVVDGTQAGDLKGYRPGQKALRELQIVSPLALAGFEKAEIRELSRLAQLPTWNKPSQSCLATRIPYGTSVTGELLSMVERAESLLWSLGCGQVRVRAHGDLARIEANPDDFPLLLEGKARERILHGFRRLGFRYVSLDLAGYRSGSWDKTDP